MIGIISLIVGTIILGISLGTYFNPAIGWGFIGLVLIIIGYLKLLWEKI